MQVLTVREQSIRDVAECRRNHPLLVKGLEPRDSSSRRQFCQRVKGHREKEGVVRGCALPDERGKDSEYDLSWR